MCEDKNTHDAQTEVEIRAIAVDWMKTTGNAHPIFGQVNFLRPVHVKCVKHIAKLLRSGKPVTTALENIRINIGLAPDSLLKAAITYKETKPATMVPNAALPFIKVQ